MLILMSILAIFAIYQIVIIIQNFNKFKITKSIDTFTHSSYFLIERSGLFGLEPHLNSEYSIYDDYTESKRFFTFDSALEYFKSKPMYLNCELIKD